MKNVENIQIQGEKQRAIYYLVEKNEKWFFRSLYPFHPVDLGEIAKSLEFFKTKTWRYFEKPIHDFCTLERHLIDVPRESPCFIKLSTRSQFDLCMFLISRHNI